MAEKKKKSNERIKGGQEDRKALKYSREKTVRNVSYYLDQWRIGMR